ncbi:(2Fe-2S) ferredoxin domain-containing protein [candidate division KSB1 bacterium]|nr:(2Fe-2S) ferredoxin domain-containing protein [candidate division KSB1 bacterium]
MPKLTLKDLEKIREKARRSTILREGAGKAKITVHMGTCGIAAGARNIMRALVEEVERGGVEDVILTNSGCAGLCSHEPMMTVQIVGGPPVKYVDLTEEKAKEIFKSHVMGREIVKEYALAIGSEQTSTK